MIFSVPSSSDSDIILCSEYDFYNFNTIKDSGNLTVTTFVSPTLNANGPDNPVAVAIQIDSLPPVTNYFIPTAKPGSLPDAWNGMDGFAVRLTHQPPTLNIR